MLDVTRNVRNLLTGLVLHFPAVIGMNRQTTSIDRKNLHMARLVYIGLCLCVLIVSGPNVAAEDIDRSSLTLIEQAYADGKISYADKLINQLTAIFEPSSLAADYKTTVSQPVKSATPIILEVYENWDALSSDQQAMAAAFLGRPEAETALESPGGFFKVHYNNAGPEMVPPEDLDGDSVPDYVERIAAYADSSLNHFIGTLGYFPPPIDDYGDGKYDIYLIAIQGYGATFPEAPADSAWNDFTSFIGIHHNFYWGIPPNDDPEGDTIGAQKVTCAHELYHAIQLAYEYDTANRWWMEMGATWMEEIIFPEVNDNYNYLPSFSSVPERRLQYPAGYHMYGGFIWPAFLTQRYDIDILKRAWEYIRYETTIQGVELALGDYESSIKHEFALFAVWNYFCGSRALPAYGYIEAADYPDFDVDFQFPSFYRDSIIPLNSPEQLACNYLEFDVDPSERGHVEVRLDGDPFVEWALSVIAFDGVDYYTQTKIGTLGQPIKINLEAIEDYVKVAAIPTVVSKDRESFVYYLSNKMIPYGDANYDLSVNVGDATYIINYVFKEGQAPKPYLSSADANCDGSVNVGDAVMVINYVFSGGPEPCLQE